MALAPLKGTGRLGTRGKSSVPGQGVGGDVPEYTSTELGPGPSVLSLPPKMTATS